MEEQLCEKCNKPKQMYYKVFCPRCDKPQLETKSFYNLFKCMYHIEAIGSPGYKQRLWENLSDQIQGNDSFIQIYEEECDENEDIKLLFDTFDIKEESVSFYVSW
jgi:hypothetical protein